MSLKKFNFYNREDFIYYLRELNLLVHIQLNVFEQYVNELEKYIKKHKLVENPENAIPPKAYEDFRSKLKFRTNYLLNAFGDQSKFGISYQNYRKEAIKKNIKLLDLNEDALAELNSLTTSRDWSAHIPASILNSTLESVNNLQSKGPIMYPEFRKLQGMWLVSLYEESYRGLQIFDKWRNNLSKEYEILTGEPCLMKSFPVEIRHINDLEVAELSLSIQKKSIKSLEEIKKYYNEKYEFIFK